MDIHKPKPVHSVRELLSELGVVVLGIIIALSGEQLLEHLRDRRNATEARENIRNEIAANLAVLGNRITIQSCIDRRLDEVARLIDADAQPGYVAPTWIGRPQIWEMVHAKWQVSSQAGRAPLLAADEQAAYGFIYALFADVAADQDHEQISWARLRALEGVARPSPGLSDAVRLELQEARLVNSDIKGLTKVLGNTAAQMRIAKQAPQRSGGSSICFATSTPRPEALARLTAESRRPSDEP